uniref:Eco57I restriction-modification methylase domain-containing protein n=1 Tax=Flavobacterium sp. TaxID=239 RepID=UPI0040497A74
MDDIKTSYSNNELKYQFYKFDASRIPITQKYNRTQNYSPRPNQQETVNNFMTAINKGRKNLLMYAVMRFGKSFTSMCCAAEMKAKIVVVVSAKADVKGEWKKTVESHVKFEGYNFLDSDSLLSSNTIINDKIVSNEKVVIFLTLQDLQGDATKNKHKEVFENNIDLLIIDETHFGARAQEYGKVLKEADLSKKQINDEIKLNDDSLDILESTAKFINSKIKLHLSGTPYRILMDSEFTDDDIIAFYQFSDITDEQQKWDEENLNNDDVKEWDNPYYGFPQLIRFAFNPNESSRKRMEEMKKNGITYAFSTLFKPKSISKDKQNNYKKFTYEKEVLDLLKVIDGSQEDDNLLSFLDYDKLKEGNMCRHIVCVLPFRASCDALEDLLLNNKFKNLNTYEIINISGLESEKLYKDTQSVKSKITNLETNNKKTITLTVNRMLTGSTVEEWDTMLYFKDTSSPQEYDQAIFRLQNQYIKEYKEPDGDVVKYNMKPQTLLVDFNPNRMFQMQEHKSQIYNVNTDSNGNNKLVERIKKELKISPIVVLNNKKIIQVQPADIIDAVRKYSSSRSVFDEATTIAIDYTLLDIEQIKAEIERQAGINSKQGLEIKAVEGDGDDINGGNDNDVDKSKDKNKKESKIKDEKENDYKGQFAMYYARILFFSFLTDSRVNSLLDIINQINNSENNLRIAQNLTINIDILKLFQEHINPFILSDLDYKIQNIDSLANDEKIVPFERASNAMKKFSRLSESEIVTPEIITDKILNSLPENAINSKSLLLDIASKQGEFVYATYKKYGKEVANNFYSIPTSKIAYEFTRKVYKLLELDINNIEKNYTSYELIDDTNLVQKQSIKINNDYMKFDAIIGNPPYQELDGGAQSAAKPIYQHFIEISKKLNPNYISMIMPTRWYAGGKGLDVFREQMLDDKNISELHDFLKPELIFQNVNLRGGVCYILWDKSFDNKLQSTKVFTYQNNLIPKTFLRSLRTEG